MELILGIIIGILLTGILQATLIGVLVYTEKPKQAIIGGTKSIAEEARRRIKGKAVLIPASSPIEQQMHEIMQRRTVAPDL